MSSKNLEVRYNGLENAKNRSKSNMLGMLTDSRFAMQGSADHATESALVFDDILLTSITPRSINQYSQTRIERLAESIRMTGNRLISPITVVRSSDLPPDGDVMRKFREKGVDTSKLEYIIVAGERRYRAFQYLYEMEERAHSDNLYFTNPFAAITANILTREEAQNEHLFYEHSNTLTRQLGPEEIMRLFETALDLVSSDTQKYCMMLEMKEHGVTFKKDFGSDIKEAARMFRKDQYCVYYLEQELGITDWNEATAKRYITVINGVCDEVKQAIYDCKYPIKEAKNITKHSYFIQRQLLEKWLNGDRAGYREMLQTPTENTPPKKVHHSNKTAAKELEALLSAVAKEHEVILEIEQNLGGEDKKLVKKARDECNSFSKKIFNIIQLLES